MATKSGWTNRADNKTCHNNLWTHDSIWCNRHVTISVWPSPETLPRSKLAETVKRGWEIRSADDRNEMVTEAYEDSLGTDYTAVREWAEVLYIRCPGDASDRPWTKIVEG